ncbi:transposase [Streptomyces albicerus]|uniref:transposase n=1 Tax=Streptomyces albicerus TaxID=2569859 RepID=UPI001788BCFD|nr:transposase [Streptomyces albicerus]
MRLTAGRWARGPTSQVAVSVHAATDTASCPLQWRLFLPTEWASDASRRTLTRIPAEIRRREKWRLALDMLGTLAGWGMTPPVAVADAAYGTNAYLRAALSDCRLAYVLARPSGCDRPPVQREARGPGPQRAHRLLASAPLPPARAVGDSPGRRPWARFTPLTWRNGSRR